MVMKNDIERVLVYADVGASSISIHHTVVELTSQLPCSLYYVSTITAAEIIDGALSDKTLPPVALFVMPGGRDIPYTERMNGKGNSILRQYVMSGGRYLGLCAGAYYASQNIEFEPATELEVIGKRELGFFPGVARGCVYPGFRYNSDIGARVIPLLVVSDVLKDSRTSGKPIPIGGLDIDTNVVSVYYNGGCWFDTTSDIEENYSVLAQYADSGLAAIIDCRVGDGKAILCGVHPEFSGQELVREWVKAGCFLDNDSNVVETNTYNMLKTLAEPENECARFNLFRCMLSTLGLRCDIM